MLETATLPILGVLALFIILLLVLKYLKDRGGGFTARVFTALALGSALGIGIHLVLGGNSPATLVALDWISLVGKGYISLLKMLVMPLVFVAIVGAFTRTKGGQRLGRIGAVVLAVLLGTVAVSGLTGWAAVAFTGLADTPLGTGAAPAAIPDALQSSQEQVAHLTIPQTILSFIPANVFADLSGSRPTSTIAVVVFSAFVGLAYLKMDREGSPQARFFKRLIASLHDIVMGIVAMVVSLTPYGVMALITNVLATSDYAAILDLGKFILISYGAILFVFALHCLIVLANRVSPLIYLRKAFPVLSFAFISRTSAGALPLNIKVQTQGLGVDGATANFAASFGLSIGQNGCAGIYPAMLATAVAPTVGIDIFSPGFVAGLVVLVTISSFGVAGVGGGATFASLIVLGTMGLPLEIVGVLASVEPLIDMARTALNVSDSLVAGITAANANGTLDRSVLGDPQARIEGGQAGKA